jgi:hypothetical protein
LDRRGARAQVVFFSAIIFRPVECLYSTDTINIATPGI